MPFASDKDASMFPAYNYNFTSNAESCWKNFHVKPRPTWITTEFGGHVSNKLLFSSEACNEC